MKIPPRLVFALLLLATSCSLSDGCSDEPDDVPAVLTQTPPATCSAPLFSPGYLPDGSAKEERQPFATADNVQSFQVGNGWLQVLGGVSSNWKMAHTTSKEVRGTSGTFGPVGDDEGRTVFVLAWTEKTDCGEQSFAVVGALLKTEDYIKVAEGLTSDPS